MYILYNSTLFAQTINLYKQSISIMFTLIILYMAAKMVLGNVYVECCNCWSLQILLIVVGILNMYSRLMKAICLVYIEGGEHEEFCPSYIALIVHLRCLGIISLYAQPLTLQVFFVLMFLSVVLRPHTAGLHPPRSR